MRRLLSLTLSFAVCLPGLVALSAAPARAQALAPAGSLDTLRRRYEQMLAVERNAATPPEVRELNRSFLEERRAQLAAAIRNRIAALHSYREGVRATLSDGERRVIDDSVTRLNSELRALLPEAVPPPAPAARRTRRPARTSQPEPASVPARDAEATAAAEAPPPAEPSADEPSAPPPARGALPIEIVSPARDRVVHTSEVELEVSVNDEEIDDLMVAVYTPSAEKPKTARVLNLKRSDRGSKTVVVALSKGDNRIEVSNLKRGEVKAERNITFQPPETPAIGAAAAAFARPARPVARPVQENAAEGETVSDQTAPTEYDWGRVRSYFTAGMVFSKENDEFSKSDLALSFVLDKNYLKRRTWNINTFFEARLTSVPVATDTAAEGEEPEEEEEEADSFDTFVKSKKAGFAQAGVYVPVNVSYWRNQRQLNTLFIAPLFKFGVMTISGDSQTAEAETFGDDDVFGFHSFGVRLGHFRYPRLRNPCAQKRADETEVQFIRRTSPFADRDCETEEDYAPELVSWLDISRGKYENFAVPVPTGQKDDDGNPLTRLENRWRWQAEGRLKIPETPFIVGFDGNFGDGPDDLRFGFGMRFELGKLIHRLKLQQFLEAKEEEKERAKAKEEEEEKEKKTPPTEEP